MEEIIIKAVSEKFSIKADKNTSITELCQDSFGKIEMLMELEQKLNCRLSDEDVLSIETIGDLIDAAKSSKKQ